MGLGFRFGAIVLQGFRVFGFGAMGFRACTVWGLSVGSLGLGFSRIGDRPRASEGLLLVLQEALKSGRAYYTTRTIFRDHKGGSVANCT